jgi:alkylhydroperoxidase family enzyme
MTPSSRGHRSRSWPRHADGTRIAILGDGVGGEVIPGTEGPVLLKRTWESVKEVMGPGALDPKVKEMIYIAVSVSNACNYCIATHRRPRAPRA